MSPTHYGQPTLYEAVPYPGSPRFFQRTWTGEPDGADEFNTTMFQMLDKDGQPLPTPPTVGTVPVPTAPLTIYGYSCRSTFAEDAPREDVAWARGSFPSVCFSTAEPHGEFGFTPVEAVTEIPRAVLEANLVGLGVDWIDADKRVRVAYDITTGEIVTIDGDEVEAAGYRVRVTGFYGYGKTGCF